MGKITDGQKQIIGRFSCERLSDKQENRNLIKSFKSEKGRSLVSYLQHLAWDEDTECIRVGHTYPGIEIVHFCSNDSMKEKWKSFNINHPMGEVMFWQYIAPIIYQVQEHIGCQYAYLFAADTSEDGNLINYYNVALKFEQPTEVGTNKPSYDLCCAFMCQEINELRKNRQEYFDNFNPDDDDIIA